MAVGDGKSIIIAVEGIFLISAEEMSHKIVEGDKSSDFAVAVGDEEKEGVGAEESVQGLLE